MPAVARHGITAVLSRGPFYSYGSLAVPSTLTGLARSLLLYPGLPRQIAPTVYSIHAAPSRRLLPRLKATRPRWAS